MVNAVSLRYELFNDKNSRRKVVSCVTSCRIKLFRTQIAYDMSHLTCRTVCHGHKVGVTRHDCCSHTTRLKSLLFESQAIGSKNRVV